MNGHYGGHPSSLVNFGEMEESCLLLCLLYLPKEKRTSKYVRSTFLAIRARVATQVLLCHLATWVTHLDPSAIIIPAEWYDVTNRCRHARNHGIRLYPV